MSTLRTDTLQTTDSSFTIPVEELANKNDFITEADLNNNVGNGGAGLIGYNGTTVAAMLNPLPIYVSRLGFGSGISDDHAGLQALLNQANDNTSIELIFDSDNDYLVSDWLKINSNTTLRFTGKGFIKLTQSSTIGGVLIAFGTDAAPANNIRIYEPRVDGNNLGYPTLAATGENGVGGSNCKDVKVYGGYIKNCKRGTSSPTGTGGKGIQFENGVEDILVDGTTIINCTIAAESGGIVDDVLPGDTFRRARLVTYTNLKAFNCERLLSISHANPTDPLVTSGNYVIDGVQAYNCGLEVPAGTEKDFGLILNDRGSNVTIRNIDIFNAVGFGTVNSVYRQRRGSNCIIENIRFHGDCDNIVNHVGAAGWGTTGQLKDNKFGPFYHFGTADLAVQGVAADGANLVENEYEIHTDVLTTGLFGTPVQIGTLSGKFVDSAKDTVIEGQFNQLALAFTNTYPVAYKGLAGTLRWNGVTVSVGAGVQTFATATDNIQFQAAGVVNLTMGAKLNIPLARLSVFADNAAATAGGLVAGDLYRTATGVVMIRF